MLRRSGLALGRGYDPGVLLRDPCVAWPSRVPRPSPRGPQGGLHLRQVGCLPAAAVRFRQVCWAHLLRDFQKLIDRGGQSAEIGRQAKEVGTWVFKVWKDFKAEGIDRGTLRDVSPPPQTGSGRVAHCGTPGGGHEDRALLREPAGARAGHLDVCPLRGGRTDEKGYPVHSASSQFPSGSSLRSRPAEARPGPGAGVSGARRPRRPFEALSAASGVAIRTDQARLLGASPAVRSLPERTGSASGSG